MSMEEQRQRWLDEEYSGEGDCYCMKCRGYYPVVVMAFKGVCQDCYEASIDRPDWREEVDQHAQHS